MLRDELLWIVVAFVVVAVLMAAMHDRHYRDRKRRLLEARLRAIEEILTEDELT